MAQELDDQANQSNSHTVIIDKSLINNKFETYKLNFDYIISAVKNDTEQKESTNNPTTSKKIQLSNDHQPIQLKNRISNISKLDNIIKRNYLFTINNTPVFYDITGIFIFNIANYSINQIYKFPENIMITNLSVTGFYHKQTSNYYIIFSHSNNKICLLKFNSSFTNISILFDEQIKDINTDFIIQNVCYCSNNNTIYCTALNWLENTENKSFKPIIHIISFNMKSNYSIHCELQGAQKYCQSFFDEKKQTFWIISNGIFKCKEKNIIKGQNNEENEQKLDVYNNDFDGTDFEECIIIQCFDLRSRNVIYTIDFHDCVASKILSINCFVNDNYNMNGDRILCVIGCEFSYDMIVFNLLDNEENGYLFLNVAILPGLKMIAKSRKNKKEILIDKDTENVFIVQHKQYISSFVNPKLEIKGIQDSLQLKYDESFVGTKIIGDKLYCLTNLNFYVLHLPHARK
eukprot:300914_1